MRTRASDANARDANARDANARDANARDASARDANAGDFFAKPDLGHGMSIIEQMRARGVVFERGGAGSMDSLFLRHLRCARAHFKCTLR